MADIYSLHKQFLGSPSSRGLRQAFILLKRKELQSATVKGTFYHHLHEGVVHVTEAHLHDC